GQRQVGQQQFLGEPGAAQQQFAVGSHDHGVAVEDQVVLAADDVDVGDGGSGLGGAAFHQGQSGVVLVAFEGRGVDVDDQADLGAAGDRERAAGLPDVLAHGHGEVDAADAHHFQGVAGD